MGAAPKLAFRLCCGVLKSWDAGGYYAQAYADDGVVIITRIYLDVVLDSKLIVISNQKQH